MVMDPITALGAAAAISQFAGQIAKLAFDVADLYCRIKEAPEVAKKQLKHIQQLETIAQSIVQNPALQTAAVAACLQSCLETTAKIEKRARKVVDGAGVTKLMNTLKAVITDDKMLKLFDELAREKVSLVLCLQEIDTRILHTMGIKVSRIEDSLQKASTQIIDTSLGLSMTLSGVNDIQSTMSSMGTSLNGVADAVPGIVSDLQRIKDEIHALSAQLNQPVVQSPLLVQTYFLVPNRRSKIFVGRQDVLSRIDKVRISNTGSGYTAMICVAAIRAMGGQGKTQIALEYCFSKRDNPYDAIFWLNATSEATVMGSFEEIYETIKPATTVYSSPKARLRYALDWFSRRDTPWLLVFDNYDKVDILIKDFFPTTGNGFIIITTRNASVEDIITPEDVYIDLQSLDDDSALDLLVMTSGKRSQDTDERVLVRDINRRLGNHALAIVQAGSYIKKLKLEFKQFLNDYESQKRKILENTPKFTEYRRRLGDSKGDKEIVLNVFTTWELSFQQLVDETSEDSNEVKLLTLLAFFDNQDISELFFKTFDRDSASRSPSSNNVLEWLKCFQVAGVWKTELFREALDTLKTLSLTQSWEMRDDNLAHTTIHPLVRDWIKLRTVPNDSNVCCSAVWLLLAATLESHFDASTNMYALTLEVREQSTRHLSGAMDGFLRWEMDESVTKDVMKAQYSCGKFVDMIGLYAQCEKLFCNILEIHTVKDEFRFDTLILLVAVLVSSKRGTEAKEFLDQASGLVAELSEADASDHLEIDLYRGETLLMLGELDAAGVIFTNGLSTSIKTLGDDHWLTWRFSHGLGSSAFRRGDYVEAEALWRKFWIKCIELYGNTNIDTCIALLNLVATLYRLRRYSEALEKLDEALATLAIHWGVEHPDYIYFKQQRVHLVKETEDQEEDGDWSNDENQIETGDKNEDQNEDQNEDEDPNEEDYWEDVENETSGMGDQSEMNDQNRTIVPSEMDESSKIENRTTTEFQNQEEDQAKVELEEEA